MKSKVIVIGGATASGKTGLALELAKHFDAEIVSADSMQIYKEMDIGTAKPTNEELKQVKHYMIDIVNPDEEFSVVKYVIMARKIIDDIISKGKVPIVVGGTGLYIDALINNTVFSESEADEIYRNELYEISRNEGNEKLFEMLKEIDDVSAQKIKLNDTKRIIRALETYKQTGKTLSYYNEISKTQEVPYEYILFGINIEREKLYNRINIRVDEMIKSGLVEEVKNLRQKYNNFPTSMQAIGYKEVTNYLDGICTYEEMIDRIKQGSRRYAKRQLTWFRRYKQMVWLNEEECKNVNLIIDKIWK